MQNFTATSDPRHSPSSPAPDATAQPDWVPFARKLLRDLGACRLARETLWPAAAPWAASAPESGGATRSLAEMFRSDAALADIRPPHEVAEMLADGEDPFRLAAEAGQKSGRQPSPRPAVLQALLRLCAGLPDEAALQETLLQPGGITLLETGDAGLDRALCELLELLPAVRGSDLDPVICLHEEAMNDDTAKPGETWPRFARDMRNALDTSRPIVLIAPAAASLPRELTALDPKPVRLPRLSADILLEHLRISHSETGRIAEELVSPHLPSPDQLGKLRLEALGLALRQPTPAEVAKAVAAKVAPSGDAAAPRFADFPLPAEAREPLEQMLRDMSDWQAGRLDWRDVTRGVLLSGPPGTGKTEIARLLACEAGIGFEAASLAEWSAAGRSSDTIRAMRAFFARAAAGAPAIAFIDELDAIDTRERPGDHNSAYTSYIVNALLDALDGFAGCEGVVFLAATNHAERIDPAVRRPSRLDRTLHIPRPGPALLPQVLRYHLRGDLAQTDLSGLTARLVGRSGAEIAALVRQARARARGKGRALAYPDLDSVLDADGPALSPGLRRRIALHEAGHAIVGVATGCARPRTLAIVGRGGFADQVQDRDIIDLDSIDAVLSMYLAGRAAETLTLGTPSAGAGGGQDSDLAAATRYAAAVECSFGLGEDGPVWYAGPEDAVALMRRDSAMRAAVIRRLAAAEDRAGQILRRNRRLLEQLAEALEQAGLLHGEKLDGWLDAVDQVSGDTGYPQVH